MHHQRAAILIIICVHISLLSYCIYFSYIIETTPCIFGFHKLSKILSIFCKPTHNEQLDKKYKIYFGPYLFVKYKRKENDNNNAGKERVLVSVNCVYAYKQLYIGLQNSLTINKMNKKSKSLLLILLLKILTWIYFWI